MFETKYYDLFTPSACDKYITEKLLYDDGVHRVSRCAYVLNSGGQLVKLYAE